MGKFILEHNLQPKFLTRNGATEWGHKLTQMGTEIKLTSSFDKQRKLSMSLLDTALGIQNGAPTGQTPSHENICVSKQSGLFRVKKKTPTSETYTITYTLTNKRPITTCKSDNNRWTSSEKLHCNSTHGTARKQKLQINKESMKTHDTWTSV